MNRSFSASHLVLAAIALFVGVALGGLGQRGDTRALESRIAELEARDCDQRANVVGEQIASALRGGAWQGQPAARPAPAPSPDEDPVPERSDAPDITGAGSDNGPAEAIVIGQEEEGEFDGEGLTQVMDAMDLRRTQARQALIEQANPTEGELQAFDTVIDDMNADLALLAEDFVESVDANGGEPDRRESMLFARETIDLMLDTEDAMFGAVGADGVDAEVLDPFMYIDGTVVEALSELQP